MEQDRPSPQEACQQHHLESIGNNWKSGRPGNTWRGDTNPEVQGSGCPLGEVEFLFVGCLTSQQHASVSQGRICLDSFTCCHTEIDVADPTLRLTQSQYTDTGPTSPSTDPITLGAWQGSHWSANFYVTGMTRPRKNTAASGIRTRDLPLSRRQPQPLGQRGGQGDVEKTSQRRVLCRTVVRGLCCKWEERP